MQKKVVQYGAMIGGVISMVMVGSAILIKSGGKTDFGTMEVIGYVSILLSLILMVVGMRAYRRTLPGGYLPFGEAFRFGLGIASVAGVVVGIYTAIHIAWIEPDFEEAYLDWRIGQLEATSISPNERNETIAEYRAEAEMYRGPVKQGIFMGGTIIIIGGLVAFASAAVLRSRGDSPGEVGSETSDKKLIS